ncbi:MAG TPA: hypothetical protein VIJ90_00770 [Gemmatimonadaceae bacterium]
MVWTGADRTKATLLRFFAELTNAQRAAMLALGDHMRALDNVFDVVYERDICCFSRSCFRSR